MRDLCQHHGNASHTWCRCMQELQSRHQHQRFHDLFLIQEHPTASADSASSQPCSDRRHLPDNTGVWSAVVLAGPTADAREDSLTSSYKKRCVCLCVEGMTWSSGSSVCLDMSSVGVSSASRVTSIFASVTLSGIFRQRPILLFMLSALWSSLRPRMSECLCSHDH